MNIIEETSALRRDLAMLAANQEWDFLTRYDLLAKKSPLILRDRIFRFARKMLAKTGVFPPYVTQYGWQPILKHAPRSENGRILLIWALGMECAKLRSVCEEFSRKLSNNPLLIPVLVTDVADFVYFSRLGWLVEYLPRLEGAGQSYRMRKQRYLAYRYRNALIVHASAELTNEMEWKMLIEADGR